MILRSKQQLVKYIFVLLVLCLNHLEPIPLPFHLFSLLLH